MAINTKLSLKRCWDMVNRVQNFEQAAIAEQWLMANEVISNEEFDELMNALSFIYRELYSRRAHE